MGKLKDKLILTPSPFGLTTHKTERTAVAVMMHWMREIIKQKDLDLGAPDVETGGLDRKMPDTIIYESRRSQNVLCVIEAKGPWVDAFDDEELKGPAQKKATQRKAKYFVLEASGKPPGSGLKIRCGRPVGEIGTVFRFLEFVSRVSSNTWGAWVPGLEMTVFYSSFKVCHVHCDSMIKEGMISKHQPCHQEI